MIGIAAALLVGGLLAAPARGGIHCKPQWRAPTDIGAVVPARVTIDGTDARVNFSLDVGTLRTPYPAKLGQGSLYFQLDQNERLFLSADGYPVPLKVEISFRKLPKGNHKIRVGYLYGERFESFFEACFSIPGKALITDFNR